MLLERIIQYVHGLYLSIEKNAFFSTLQAYASIQIL